MDFVFQNVKPVRYEVDTSVVRSETTGFMLHYYVCYTVHNTILRETNPIPTPLFATKSNKLIMSNVVRHENYRGILVPCSLQALRSRRPKTEGLESSVPKRCVPQIIFEGLSSGLCFTSVKVLALCELPR